jgi:hypothetical protein
MSDSYPAPGSRMMHFSAWAKALFPVQLLFQ